MVFSSHPVPSKNALRALRDLAFSTPTIVAGAVGSACCVAALGCEARSRVRLAEKVVATKRTLRSVSDGQGKARVARMFEAAERGDDFLLDPRSAQRRRRSARHYSARAVEAEDQHHNMEELQNRLAAIPVRVQAAREHGKSPHQLNEDIATSTTQGMAHSMHRNVSPDTRPGSGYARLHPVHAVASTDSRTVGPSQRLQAPSLVHTDPGFSSPRAIAVRASPERSASKTSEVGPSSPNSDAAERIRKASMASHKPANRSPRLEEVQETSSSDPSFAIIHEADPQLSDLHAKESTAPASKPLPGEIHNELLNEHLFTADDFTALESAFEEQTLFDFEMMEAADDEEGSPEFEDPGRIFAQKHRHAFASHLISDDEAFRRAWNARILTMLASRDPYDMSKEKEPTTDLNDATEAQNAAEEESQLSSPPETLPAAPDPCFLERLHANLDIAVTEHLNSNDESSVSKAEEAFHSLYDSHEHGLLPPIAAKLLHRLLSDTSTKARVVDIFSHESDESTEADRDRLRELRIQYYMQKFCVAGTSSLAWKREYDRIVSVLADLGQVTTTRSAETFLRALCWAEGPADAETYHNTLQKKYALQRSMHVDRVIMLAYARSGDWSAVNRIMSEMQELQIPRTQPFFFSRTFNMLYQIHLRDHSFDASYDYLINAMGYWKLTPTSHISQVFIAACVKARRFNYIREWIETTRQMWPRLVSGPLSRRSAYAVGQALIEIEATCKDVEDTCRALAHGSLSDPFAGPFRSTLRDVLCAALERQYLSTLRAFGMDTRMPMLRPGNLRDEICRMQDLVRVLSQHQNPSPDRRAALESLDREIHGIRRVDGLTRGTMDHSEAQISLPLFRTDAVHSPKEIQSDDTIDLPEPFNSSDLPWSRELFVLVADLYIKYRQADQAPPHDILYNIARKLLSQDRSFEVVKLLRSVHFSPFVQGYAGAYFPSKLYILWLDVCGQRNTAAEGTTAMWALLDASRDLVLTAEHMLAASLAVTCHQSADATFFNPENAEEAEYVFDRLRKQRWKQQGAVEGVQEMSMWQTWQEQIHAP